MTKIIKCNEATIKLVDKNIKINGWVQKIRIHSKTIFINLRDRYGLIQIIIEDKNLFKQANSIKMEYCISIEGKIRKRPQGMINLNLETGEFELVAKKIEILASSLELPFMIEDFNNSSENAKLEYRYLDLRRPKQRDKIILRSKVYHIIRNFMVKKNFLEIETPTFVKSTPEGARDFLIPSRIHKGMFYALPQSPQLYKQLCMIGGFDKYFQIARCYRDEDSRGDRQPEFTQLDIEMSFIKKEKVFKLIENLMHVIFKTVLHTTLPKKFKKISFKNAMNTYGTDKPDLRYDLTISDFTKQFKNTKFSAFNSILKNKGCIKGIILKKEALNFSRTKINNLEKLIKLHGAKGLAWFKLENNELTGGISKFIKNEEQMLIKTFKLEEKDIVFLVADKWKIACQVVGQIRIQLALDLNLINDNKFEFAWIEDFPLFEFDENKKNYIAAHHMFSMPKYKYLKNLEKNPAKVIGEVYDLVLNGNELGSGSIRINNRELQQKIFDIIGINHEKAENNFDFFLKALEYGAPTHGGIALGLDRLLMLITKSNSIKEVITFPKNSFATSPLDNSPTVVTQKQLKELGITLNKE